MYILISILVFLAAILLILIVLVQNSKGGGLSSGFSASNQVMGVRKTTDFLEKATWSLAAFICVFSVVASSLVKNNVVVDKQSAIKEEVQSAVTVDPNLVTPDFGTQDNSEETPSTN
jgi:preprotein translocase subunit SecG